MLTIKKLAFATKLSLLKRVSKKFFQCTANQRKMGSYFPDCYF